MASSRSPEWYRQTFRDVSANKSYVAASTSDTGLIVGKASHTVYIQKISVSVTTTAAQTWTFQDDATTPVVVAVLSTSPSVGSHEWDFGAAGIPLTEGKNLDLVMSAAGIAGRVAIDAYLKPSSTMVPSAV